MKVRYWSEPDVHRQRARQWRLDNPEAALESDARSRAEHREERNEYSRRYHATHREEQAPKQRVRSKRWEIDNPEKHRAVRAAIQDRRRAKKYGCTCDVDWSVYFDLMALPCHYCGADPPGGVDHVIPPSRGGHQSYDNLVPCCEPCNERKRDKIVLTLEILRHASTTATRMTGESVGDAWLSALFDSIRLLDRPLPPAPPCLPLSAHGDDRS